MPKRLTRADVIAAVVLCCLFIGIVVWFGGVDFYHRHFFDSGLPVAANNVVRMAFVAMLAWLIYAPGASVAALIAPGRQLVALTPAERVVIGAGIGLGLWHVAMLILGVLNLYYRSVMIFLCLAVLLGSARRFAETARSIAEYASSSRRRTGTAYIAAVVLIASTAAWLLLVRGLYPGGGHDYYTHYFPYYLAVLENHGLAPNDVWYHFYYSKGCGLIFLGMILTDPECPALVTFCYVAFAVLAVATLAARVAPRSLWAACCASLYLLFYVVSVSGHGGGDFQKDHEEVAALVTIGAWAICMMEVERPRIFIVLAAAAGAAAALVTQPAGVILGLFYTVLAGGSLARRQWRRAWGYGLAAAATSGAVFGVLILNYAMTGLVSDQALNLMLRFANVARLDQWGVIPQIAIVAWIRDNYELVARPMGWEAIHQLVSFTRLDVFWTFLSGILVLFLITAGLTLRYRPWTRNEGFAVAPGIVLVTIGRLGLLLGLLVLISIFAGRTQVFSFARFSTFYVPLLLMFGVACVGWLASCPGLGRFGQFQRIVAPVLLLAAAPVSWEVQQSWWTRAVESTTHAWRYAVGLDSLAKAYTYFDLRGADGGFSFGGINPVALAAARQLPPGTPIWSTNLDTYCMVPGCVIETVVSFKMSGRLDEIMTGPPERAKQLLREANLNYFLIVKDEQFLDLLPYSKLFAPATIGQYLGVKWSEGTAFLLTWSGPDTTPIGPEFLDVYGAILAQPEHVWFRFSELIPQLGEAVASLRAMKPWETANFPWRRQAEDGGGQKR